jgi:hypothetical protein
MAARKPAIHTVPVDGGWANRPEGAQRSGPKFATEREAETAGRERARRDRTEHISHLRDGRIGERRSYGNDPPERPG